MKAHLPVPHISGKRIPSLNCAKTVPVEKEENCAAYQSGYCKNRCLRAEKIRTAALGDAAVLEISFANAASYLVAVVAVVDSVFSVAAVALSASISARRRRGGTSCGASGAFFMALLTLLVKSSRLKRASPTTGGAVT